MYLAGMSKKAIIIGAGPAGLTAAYELLKRTTIVPIILEKSGDIGGISKTVNYKGNRIDIGGHRFFSKSDRVMEWWLNILPLEPTPEKQFMVTYQRRHKTIKTEEHLHGQSVAGDLDKVMLVRRRSFQDLFPAKVLQLPHPAIHRHPEKIGLCPYHLYIGIIFKSQAVSPQAGKKPGRFLYQSFPA